MKTKKRCQNINFDFFYGKVYEGQVIRHSDCSQPPCRMWPGYCRSRHGSKAGLEWTFLLWNSEAFIIQHSPEYIELFPLFPPCLTHIHITSYWNILRRGKIPSHVKRRFQYLHNYKMRHPRKKNPSLHCHYSLHNNLLLPTLTFGESFFLWYQSPLFHIPPFFYYLSMSCLSTIK